MKKYLFYLFKFLLFSFISANDAPDTLWTKTYGGDSSDMAWSVQQTYDGGFAVAGYTKSFGAGNEDFYLVRTDSIGDTLWTKTYGGDSVDIGRSILQASDGGFFITGFTNSFGMGSFDIYLVRTDSLGDTLWTKTYGGILDDIGKSTLLLDDGGLIIAGETKSFGAGNGDAYLIRTDSLGDTLWTKTYGYNGWDSFLSITQTDDNGFVAVGFSVPYGVSRQDVYLVRTDSVGDSLWAKTFNFSINDVGWGVHQANDGGFTLIVTPSTSRANIYNFRIVHTNAKGDFSWAKTYNDTSTGMGFFFQKVKEDGFIIAGNIVSPGGGGDDSDVYLMRIDSNGDTLWTKTCGGENSEAGASVQQTSDGGFIIAGCTNPLGSGYRDIYLVRLAQETTLIQNDKIGSFSKKGNLNVYYHYRKNTIYVRYTIPYSGSVRIEAYNTHGKLLKSITDKFVKKGSYAVRLDLKQNDNRQLANGVYFIKLKANGCELSGMVTIFR